jgi:hypothetical protein
MIYTKLATTSSMGNMMSLYENGAWHRSLYTLLAIVLLAAVALSFLGMGFVCHFARSMRGKSAPVAWKLA